MRYSKPEVVRMASAIEAILGQNKADTPQADSGLPKKTAGAYEADE